jgi:hypothetical protein
MTVTYDGKHLGGNNIAGLADRGDEGLKRQQNTGRCLFDAPSYRDRYS